MITLCIKLDIDAESSSLIALATTVFVPFLIYFFFWKVALGRFSWSPWSVQGLHRFQCVSPHCHPFGEHRWYLHATPNYHSTSNQCIRHRLHLRLHSMAYNTLPCHLSVSIQNADLSALQVLFQIFPQSRRRRTTASRDPGTSVLGDGCPARTPSAAVWWRQVWNSGSGRWQRQISALGEA